MMKIEELKKIVKGEQNAPHVFVLWGEEVFLKSHYFKQLQTLLEPDGMAELNVFRFDGKEYDVHRVDEAIEALPVMAGQKLLLFHDSFIFKPDGRTGAKAGYREYWAERLRDIPNYVYIIFNESEIDKRSALLKQADKTGACVEFSYLSESEMVRWTQKLFATMGKEIAAGDAAYLNEVTQGGMMGVRREAEKLAAFCDDIPTVTRADIDRLVTPPLEGKVFDMVAAMLQHNTEQALHLLYDMFDLKMDANQILPPIIYNADKLLQTKLLMQGGADKAAIVTELKISPFAATKFMRDSAKYSVQALRQLIHRLSETDGFIKSNSMDNESLVTWLVCEFSTSK